MAALASLVEAGCGETVLAALLPATRDKVPKAAAAAVDALRSLLVAFGPGPHLPLQPVFKDLPALFESKTGAVREGAKATAVELSRWRGASAAVRATLLPAVPAAARAEVEKAVAEAETEASANGGGKQPERFTREEAERRRRRKAEAEAAAAAAAAAATAPMEVDGDDGATTTTTTAAPPPLSSSFDDDEAAPSDHAIDPYDLAQPLDVLGRLPKTFWAALKAAKWSERRSALQQLREAAAAPGVRLSGCNADFTEICRALKGIISKDSNAAVVSEAGLAAAALAVGARREFSSPGRMLLGPLLGKLKDKQTSVCLAVAAGARAFLVHCCSGGLAGDTAEEIAAALTAVSPKGRALAAGVFAEAVSLFSASDSSKEAAATSAAKALSTTGPLAKALAKCASDADPAVRAAAVGALAALAKAAGVTTKGKAALDKLVSSSMLDARTRAKVDAEAAAAKTATTTASAAKLDAAPRRSAAAAAASSPVGPFPAAVAAAALAPAQRARAMIPPSRSSPALSRSKPLRASAAASSSSSSSADDSAPFEPASMSASEAEAFLEAVLGPGGGDGTDETKGEAVGAKSARASSWKARLAAMDLLLGAVSSTSSSSSPLPDADLHLVPACLSAVPGWSDSNFQVVARALAVVAAVAERFSSSCSPSSMPPSAAAAGALGAAERLGDPKLKPAALDALDALACVPSSGGPALVLSVLKSRATSASKKGGPKLPAEALRWAARCVSDFGAAACCFGNPRRSSSPPPPPRFLMAWARQALDAPQPEVRAGGTALLCALHRQCGRAVAAAAKEGLKPAAAASLDSALDGSPFDAGFRPAKRLLVQEEDALAEMERPAAAPRATAKRAPAVASSPSAVAPAPASAADERTSIDENDAADDALLPRKDISSALTPALFARFSHPNWKERNAALGEVEDAIERAAGQHPSAKRVVLSSCLGPLPALLAERASRDVNANISARAFCVATTLSLSMRGPDFDRVARAHLLAPALSALGDKKRAVREAAEALLDAWASALPADKLLPAVCEAACGTSSDSSSSSSSNKNKIVISSGSEGRAAALLWLARAVEREALKKSSTALSPECVSALVRAAGRGWADKAASAREGGIALACALRDSCSNSSSSSETASSSSRQLVSARALVAAANRLAAAPARAAAREALRRAGVLATAEEEEEEEDQQRRAPAAPVARPPPAASTPVAAAQQQQQQQQRTPGSVSALGATAKKTPAPPTTTTPTTTATPVASASRRLSAPTPAPPPTVVAAPVYNDNEEEEGEDEEFRTASSDEEEEEDPVAAWDSALADLHAPDAEAAIEGIKFLLRDLGTVAAGTAPSALTERCAEDADALVAELARRVDPAFDDLLCQFSNFNSDTNPRISLSLESDDDLASRSARGARTAKYVLNALLSAFAARPVARAVRPRALRAAVGALLGRLLDDALPRAGSTDSNGLSEGATLLKGLNVLMLRVLDAAHPDAAYAALLALLRSPPARVRAMMASGASSSSQQRNHRFDDLVVKCLAKLARNLREALPAMDPAALLLAVHECLESLGSSSSASTSASASPPSASASSSDRPARAVKALLLELCRARGAEAMRGDLEESGLLVSGSNLRTQRPPLVVSLVDLHLRTLFGPGAGIVAEVAAPVAAVAAAAPAPHRSSSLQEQVPPAAAPRSPVAAPAAAPFAAASASTPVAPPASSSTATAATTTTKTPSTSSKAELAAIFRRIGLKETSEEGLAELAAFGRARGGIRDETGSGVGLDLGPHLARTSEHFRAYIARGVARANAKFEEEEKRKKRAATPATPSAVLSAAAAALITPSRLPPLPPSPAPTPPAESAYKQQREPLRQHQQQSPSFTSSAAGPAEPSIKAAAVPAAAATSVSGATSTFSAAPVAASSAGAAPSLDELRARVAAVRLSATSANSGEHLSSSAAAKGEPPSCGGRGVGGAGVGISTATNSSTLQALQARMAALRRARQ